jgi:hypothetical protein
MKIVIDTEEVSRLGISCIDYLYLYLRVNNIQEDTLSDIYKLEELGYVKDIGDGISIRQKAYDLFKVDINDVEFLDFWNTYPMKVPNGKGGVRPLRPGDPDTKIGKEIKAKYLRLIKSKAVTHKRLLGALNSYLNNQRSDMQFFVGIEVFLNGAYEKYLDMEVDNSTSDRVEAI